MPWFKIDDGFWSHPKVLELTDEAIALWVRAGSYCAGHLTDGVVKRSTLRVLGADHNAATELVIAGLWDHDEGKWSFHDWYHYQPSRESVIAEREAAAERMRQLRANRKARSAEQVTNVQEKFEDGSPSPTRPDPTPVEGYVSEVSLVSSEVETTSRPDVEHILAVLDEELTRNGSKPTGKAQRNIDAARLLLDRDGRTADQVVRAIRWCQADEFWRANILSMSKLREKYDQLRLAAERKRTANESPTSKADRNAAEFHRLYGGTNERAGSVPALDPGVG